MRYRLRALLVVLVIASPSAAGESLIVSLRAKDGPARFKEYSAQFDVTPAEAQILVEKFRDSLPQDARPSLATLMGMVDDEYMFSYPLKEGYSLRGYRVNAKTGVARYVTGAMVRAQYGARYRNGYLPFRDAKTPATLNRP